MAEYATTSIDTATPVVDLMTWLDGKMTTNGWTFVETWTSGTKVANVYKSPAAGNSVGVDFYVAFYRSTTTSVLTVLLFEDWDAVNKKARKYAPASGSGITVNVTDNTVTDATGVLLDSATLSRVATVTLSSGVAQVIYLDVDANKVVVANSSQASAAFAYAGVYESLLPASIDPVPLVVWNGSGHASGSSSALYGASTREPTAPAVGQYNFQMHSNVPTVSDRFYAYGVMTGSATSNTSKTISSSGDLYRAGSSQAAKIVLVSSRVATSTVSNQNAARGLPLNVVTSYSGGARGDTLTETRDDGTTRTYVLVQVAASGVCHIFVRTS